MGMGVMNVHKNWKDIDASLEPVKSRPNDMQQLIVLCHKNGMPMIDIARVFQLTDKSTRAAVRKYSGVETVSDREYFTDRAKKLGLSEENLSKWFSE